MRIVRTLGACVLGALVASTADAQGIGDKAAQERAKRAQAKSKEAKVFTNTDLDAGRPPGSKPSSEDQSASAAAQSSEPSAPASSPDPYAERREQDKVYVDAVTAAQAQVASVEARIKELNGKLNPMSLSYIYGSGGSNDANEEQRVRAELRQAEEELTSARQAVAQANQNLQDFRQGRPVGASEPR
jgi:hypothetical protein